MPSEAIAFEPEPQIDFTPEPVSDSIDFTPEARASSDTPSLQPVFGISQTPEKPVVPTGVPVTVPQAEPGPATPPSLSPDYVNQKRILEAQLQRARETDNQRLIEPLKADLAQLDQSFGINPVGQGGEDQSLLGFIPEIPKIPEPLAQTLASLPIAGGMAPGAAGIKLGAGAVNAGIGFAKGVTTPLALATLVEAALPETAAQLFGRGAITRAATPLFAAQMAQGAVQAVPETAQAISEGDIQRAAQTGLGGIASGFLAGHLMSTPLDRILTEAAASPTPITAATVAGMREAAVAPERTRIFEADFRPKPAESIPQAAPEVAVTTEVPNAGTIQSSVAGTGGEPPGPAAQVAEGVPGEVQQSPGTRPTEGQAPTTETGQAAATVGKEPWQMTQDEFVKRYLNTPEDLVPAKPEETKLDTRKQLASQLSPEEYAKTQPLKPVLPDASETPIRDFASQLDTSDPRSSKYLGLIKWLDESQHLNDVSVTVLDTLTDRYSGHRVGGIYDPTGNVIYIGKAELPDATRAIRYLAHEAAHAALFRKLQALEGNDPTARAYRASDIEIFNRMKSLMARAREEAKARGVQHYGLNNIHEFSAEAMTRLSFQKFLDSIKIEGQTAWSRFVDMVKSLFNFSGDKSVLSETLRATGDLLDSRVPTEGILGAPRSGTSIDRVGARYATTIQGEHGVLRGLASESPEDFLRARHQGHVERALREGKQVPARVLADYAKLKPAQTPQATAGESPVEVAAQGETPPQIGIRNAVTDQVREAMGLNQRTTPDRIGGEQQLQEASNLIAQDPQRGSRLVDELGQKPRPLTYQEDGILTYELAARVTEHRAAMRAVEEATTPEAKAEAETRLANARDRVASAVEADANAGTENARGLEARKRLIDEQYSLPVMEANRRIAKGEPLTNPELDRLKAHAEELDALEKQIQERAQANAIQTARQAFTQLLSEHANTVREAKASGGTIVQFLDKQAEAARQRIKERLTGAKSTATDPVTAALAHLADEAIIGASHIAHGLKDIGEWSKKMIAEFGEGIRPHLDKIYRMAQDYHDSSEPLFKPQRKGKTPEIRDATAEAKTAADAGEGLTRKTVYDLARAHVKDGMTNLDEVMEAVRKDLEPSFPGVTVRDIRDTFSDYGKTKLPNPAADLKTLRDLRAQSQKISALEDVARKQAPKRSGMQRDKPSDVVRELTRKLNEAMREAGIEVTSPEQQLKTSLDAVKTRLKNQLSDLDHETSQLEKGIVERKEKTGIKYDAEAETLKKQRDAKAAIRDSLREALVGVEPRKGITPEQSERNALAAAKRSLEEYQRRVREKDFAARRKPAKEASEAVKAARAERDAAKTEFEQLRDALKPKLSPEQAALKRAKQANERSIKELERKLATKDFAAKVRGAQPIDAELESLQAKKQRLRDQVDRETEAIRLSKRGLRERIGDNFVRIERAMKLSGPAVSGKLTMAAATRLGTIRGEALLSRGISKLPVINRIAAKAPSMAGRRVSPAASAIAKAVTDGLMDGLRQMKNVLKTGQSDLDVRLGKRRIAPENPWVEAFGRIHAALKNPVKYDAFRLSLEQRVEHGIRNGVDVTNPAVHLQMMKDAYVDANRSIFMQDNFLSNAYQMGVGYLRRGASFKEGQPGFAAAQSLGHLAQFLLPIVKVPTNIAFETGSYAGGLAKASVGVAKALKNGMDTVSPEQADDIMRHLTKGSIGAGLLLLGFYNPENIGGYYQPGEKRKLNEPKASGFRLFGQNLPRWVAHAPVFEVLQMGATIRRVSDQIVKATGQKKGLEAGGEAAAMGLLKELPFMDEMHRLNSLMGSDSDRAQFLGELAKGTFVPAISQQAASFFDTRDSEGNPVPRKPTSIWQHVKMGIPGLRETVPLKPQPKTTR